MGTIENEYKTKLGYAFNTVITTMTPLHIGTGDNLSPLGDYFIKNGRVYFIDSNKFGRFIIEQNKTNKYIKEVLNIMDESKSDFIENFFRGRQDIDIIDNLTEVSYPAYVMGNPVELAEYIKSDEKAFIPGSSLKGAIRSAILFDWLFTDSGNHKFEEWFAGFTKIYNDKSISNKEIIRKVETNFQKDVEEQFYGDLRSPQRLAMSCLRITDSDFVNTDQLAAYEIFRYNLTTGNGDIPTLKECIDKDTKLNLRISVDFDKMQVGKAIFPSQLNSLTNYENLCEVINQYSQNVLQYESEVMSYRDVKAVRFTEYADWMGKIKEQVDKPEQKTAYLRLGQGKMQFYQTIGMKVFDFTGRDEDNDDWIHYLEYCNNFKKDIVDTYPITRSLTAIGQVPLGWVKLAIK